MIQTLILSSLLTINLLATPTEEDFERIHKTSEELQTLKNEELKICEKDFDYMNFKDSFISCNLIKIEVLKKEIEQMKE